MEWKTIGKRTKLGSARHGLSRIIRMIHNPAGEAAGCASQQEDNNLENFNLRAYMESNRRMREIETQQALAITLSGHERWKAGRPV